MRNVRACFPLLGLLLLAAAGDPPASDVVAQRGDVKITVSDLSDILSNIDPSARARLQANPGAMAEFVRERIISRTLLNDAHSKGWDRRPDVLQRANDARDQVVLQTYVSSLVPADPNFPSEAEVSAAYEANKGRLMLPKQYHIAQIVILVPAGASRQNDEAARKKAADLRAQAAKPKADFAELARKNSQEAASAPKGGDVGWLREDQVLPAVREAIVKLPDGGISEPIRAPDGWHVLRVMDTRAPGPMSLADATPQLTQALRQAHAQQTMRSYIADMLRSQPIQVNEIELSKAAPK